jgi:carbamoyltransferase
MESVVEWLHAYSTTHPAVLWTNPFRRAELLQRLAVHSREDIAATLQAVSEEHVIEILRRARDLGWQSDSICLSGGLFANVKINQRVKEFGFRRIYISPPMTDDGTALGAALAVAAEHPSFSPAPAPHMFLGPGYDTAEIRRSLNEARLCVRPLPNPEEYLAERLAEGAVVGIFQGRAEFGPRALGNRSILSQATNPEINRNLNARLRRTEFMPFAPITRVEDSEECYVGLEGAERAAEFMTITCECTGKMRYDSPAVVHVDGTARPQLVRREVHPLIHGILSAYRERTGIASLINTSFNVHEEPIVCSPEDAIRGFLEAGLDLLYLESGFLVSFEENLKPAVECLRQSLAQNSREERQTAAVNAVLAQQAAERDNELSALREHLTRADETAREQHKRSLVLEKAAEERLLEMQEKDRAMDELRLASRRRLFIPYGRERALQKLLSTVEELRGALENKNRVLDSLRAELAVRTAALEEATAMTAELRRRLKFFEQLDGDKVVNGEN